REAARSGRGHLSRLPVRLARNADGSARARGRRLDCVRELERRDRSQALAGADAQHLQPVAAASKSGFETPIRLGKSAPFYAVRAIGSNGKVLGTSRA